MALSSPGYTSYGAPTHPLFIKDQNGNSVHLLESRIGIPFSFRRKPSHESSLNFSTIHQPIAKPYLVPQSFMLTLLTRS